MHPCRKKVLLAFGVILFAVVFFVPCRSVRVSEKRERGSNLITRTTTAGRSFFFMPRFLKAVSLNGTIEKGLRETYRLDAVLYAGEIAAVLFLAVLDLFFLCPKGRPRRPGQGF